MERRFFGIAAVHPIKELAPVYRIYRIGAVGWIGGFMRLRPVDWIGVQRVESDVWPLRWRGHDLALSAGSVTQVDLAERYPWPEGPWLRVMMAMTFDGAVAGPDGRSGSISSPTDRQVLAETRRLADVVLVGAATIRAERYRPMVQREEWQAARAEARLRSAPVVAIVSGRLDLPWEEPLFSNSEFTPIVFYSDLATPDAIARAQGNAELIHVAGAEVAANAVVDALHERGLTRIVCEGGPILVRSLLEADRVDEVDLTLSPVFAGGMAADSNTVELTERRWTLDWVLEDHGFVFTRYLR